MKLCMIYAALSIVSCFYAASAMAQTTDTGIMTPAKITQSAEVKPVLKTETPDAFAVISTDSVQPQPINSVLFKDAYELGLMDEDPDQATEAHTEDDLSRIKESFIIPKTKKDVRYKPQLRIRAGDEKPKWQSGE